MTPIRLPAEVSNGEGTDAAADGGLDPSVGPEWGAATYVCAAAWAHSVAVRLLEAEVRRRALDRADDAPAGFARVHVIDGAGEGGGTSIEVVFRGGERLTIPGGTSPDVVHAVILALRAAC